MVDSAIAVAREWQTLIASIIAIGAAWLAARPVWRQLDRMETQTDTMVRQIYLQRIGELEARLGSITTPVRKVVEAMSRDLGWWEETGGSDIEGEWAFNHEQGLRIAMSAIAASRTSYKDIEPIETLKDLLDAAVTSLTDSLDTAHRPDSLDEDDPEQPITDEQWKQIVSDAENAKRAIPTGVAAVRQAYEALEQAYREEAARLRTQLVTLDVRLTGG